MDEWRIERLDRGHVRQDFDCGKSPLNDFLHSLVSQYEKRNLGRAYVAVLADDRRVLGYYTLASGAVETASLLAKQAKKLPRHAVPVVLLGTFGVLAAIATVLAAWTGVYVLIRPRTPRAFPLSRDQSRRRSEPQASRRQFR